MSYLHVCVALHLVLSVCGGPIVTLKHGGQLEGKTVMFNDTNVNVFLGVRYAEPPVGSLRFKKPVDPLPWSGVKSAASTGNICSQLTIFGDSGKQRGSEDCLFLEITTPSSVGTEDKKAVMIWIHGGGYIGGSGTGFSGAPLAVYGGVVVVNINYRLGIMGFLSDGEGTGNYGLWDQRQAIIWVRENIDRFGGDPSRITIFGESAGAGSVSAQLMGQHNQGLFQRAIQQSGSLYADWGWFLSENRVSTLNHFLRQKGGCALNMPIFECLSNKTIEEIESYRSAYDTSVGVLTQWHPRPDNDFFNADIVNGNYTFPTRADLLLGFNGQEGAAVTISGMMFGTGVNTAATVSGYTGEMARTALLNYCTKLTPMSAALCLSFLLKTYNITDAADNQERLIRLSYAFGEISFNADAIRQLRIHSASENSTYAYYFTNLFHSKETSFFEYPAWMKTSADHADEIPFVWGMILAKEEYRNLSIAYYGEKGAPYAENLAKNLPTEFKELSEAMVTMWTNFAKTGDPNTPQSIPNGIPVWPEFTTDDDKFMELNSKGSKLITTPNKQRIEKLISVLLKAMREQTAADKAPVRICENDEKNKAMPAAGNDAVIG